MSGRGSLYQLSMSDPAAVSERVLELRGINLRGWEERVRIQQAMNSRTALSALVGDFVEDASLRMPIANLIVKGAETLARKIGRNPSTKVDPPVTKEGESELGRKRADKRARIVDAFDEISRLEMLLPQVGRWLPVHGFTAGVLRFGKSPSGDPYPLLELRDPIQTFPGEWGASQQPMDLAVIYRMSRDAVARMFPDAKPDLVDSYRRGTGGAVLLGMGTAGVSEPSWMSQSGGEVDVYEYIDERGCWYVLPDSKRVLSFVPNVLSSPAFRVAKRFSFAEVVGEYDHTLGVMALMARLALLNAIGIEDSVLSETNIFGSPPAGMVYDRGRNSVNLFPQGTTVARANTQVPFEAFQQIDRMERQMRLAAGHSEQDDGQAGSGWSTGKGLEQLQGSAGAEVQEYQLVLRYWLQDLDAQRLEADEVACDVEKMMYGIRGGAPFAEKYTPSKDIKGDYRTRRVYGAMSTLDDGAQIVGGLQLVQGKIIDRDTMREQLDGLENASLIKERILTDDLTEVALSALSTQAANGDPNALQAVIQLLPTSTIRTTLERLYPPPDPNAQPAMAGAPGAPGAAPQGPPPDVTTVMSKANLDGSTTGAARTIGTL